MSLDLLGWSLRIRSELAIAGAVPAEGAAAPDVMVSLGAAETLTGSTRFPYIFGDGTILFEPPGVGRYRIEPDRIIVEPAPGAAEDDVAALLVATALPALLWMRGCFVLHAACVVGAREGAFAFAGASGTGKSLLSASLVREGRSLVGDDTVILTTEGAQVIAAGLPGGQFVADVETLSLAERAYAEVPPEQRRGEAPLKAICLLRPADGTEPGLTRLESVQSVAALLANRHRPAVPRGLRLEARSLEQAGNIAGLVPIYALDFDPARIAPDALITLLAEA